MIKVLIGGDVCPIGRNQETFENGDAQAIFTDLLSDFEQADLSIVNLECPFITETTPIRKTGPNLGVSNQCVQGLKAASIKALNLANNHILDHGEKGLLNTLEVCREAGLQTFGAGKNLQQARDILVFNVQGLRIGLIGVAEHEFSIAGDDRAGANPLDLIDFMRNVRERREDFDYLIVLLHGGNEYYAYPSPRLAETCRFMIEMGANVVICQHSHCAGCYEKYRDGNIVYGQGNLIFDYGQKGSAWNQGFLVKLNIEDEISFDLEFVPFIQSDVRPGARSMLDKPAAEFVGEIETRSKSILQRDFIKNQWLDYCFNSKYTYQNSLLMPYRILKWLNGRGWLARLLYPRKHLIRLHNLIRCEAHHEVIETILENRYWG